MPRPKSGGSIDSDLSSRSRFIMTSFHFFVSRLLESFPFDLRAAPLLSPFRFEPYMHIAPHIVLRFMFSLLAVLTYYLSNQFL